MQQSIKFREDTRNDLFYQQLRESVQLYLDQGGHSGYATPLVWAKALLYSGLLLGAYLFILLGHYSFGQSLAAWSLLGVSGILLGLNLAHDAAHDALTPDKRLNKILFYLSFNALGANAYLWQLRHVESHHLFPNVDDCDADIDDNPLFRLTPGRPLLTFHRIQHIYAPALYLWYTLVWIFLKDFIILKKKRLANLRHIRHPKREIRLFYWAKIGYLLLFLGLPLYLSPLAWPQVLAGFLCMHFVQSYAFIFGLAPSHFAMETAFPQRDAAGYLPRSWAGHQVAASLDYHPRARWANFIFGGFNAHVAHHLFPQICHVHYPAISALIRQAAAQHGIPYHERSWLGALRSHFQFLKYMGRKG